MRPPTNRTTADPRQVLTGEGKTQGEKARTQDEKARTQDEVTKNRFT